MNYYRDIDPEVAEKYMRLMDSKTMGHFTTKEQCIREQMAFEVNAAKTCESSDPHILDGSVMTTIVELKTGDRVYIISSDEGVLYGTVHEYNTSGLFSAYSCGSWVGTYEDKVQAICNVVIAYCG